MTSTPNEYPQANTTTPVNGLAIAGMVLGIAGFAVALVPFVGWLLSSVPALLAIIFGHIGHAIANRNGVGKRAAITGWATGYAALGVPILYFLISGIVGILAKA